MTYPAILTKHTATFAEARAALCERLKEFDTHYQALVAQYGPTISVLSQAAAREKEKLEATLKKHAAVFDSPRTVVLNGVKIGFQKGKDTLVIDDEEAALEALINNFSDQFEVFTRTKTTLDKAALKKANNEVLAACGAHIEPGQDEVVIAPQAGLDGDALISHFVKG